MNAKATSRNEGFALVVAVLYTAIITALVASVIGLIMNEIRFAASAEARSQALYAAESGVALALREFNRAGKNSWQGWTPDGAMRRLETTPDLLRRGSKYSPGLKVSADTDALVVEAMGLAVAPGRPAAVSRKVVVTLQRRGGQYKVSSWEVHEQ